MLDKPLQDLVPDDIAELVSDEIGEGLTLEYKAKLNLFEPHRV